MRSFPLKVIGTLVGSRRVACRSELDATDAALAETKCKQSAGGTQLNARVREFHQRMAHFDAQQSRLLDLHKQVTAACVLLLACQASWQFPARSGSEWGVAALTAYNGLQEVQETSTASVKQAEQAVLLWVSEQPVVQELQQAETDEKALKEQRAPRVHELRGAAQPPEPCYSPGALTRSLGERQDPHTGRRGSSLRPTLRLPLSNSD